ncbi:MAG: GtrA family protein [Hyphomicrobiaceae bacterium]|nr:GtrA family protein [Hyphomicrobiaceae bacterium]
MPEPMAHARCGNRVGPMRHYGGFVLAGLLALATDGLVLVGLARAGWHPIAARPLAIAIAMVVSWLVNRRLTFAMPGPPTLREYARFAAVSWSAQAVNYLVFGAILIGRPATPVLLALVLASLVAMFVSYFGFRHGVFSHVPLAPWEDEPSRSKT